MIAFLAALLGLWPAVAQAHVAATSAEPLDWRPEPWAALGLALTLLIYVAGVVRLTRRGHAGRHREARLFLGGWLVLAGAVASPLHQLGGRAFSAHMLEHELMMLAAAPLLVLSRPLGPMLWAFPGGVRQALAAVGRIIGPLYRPAASAVGATLLQAAALWIWHAPGLFDLALRGEGWHAAQHLSFLVTALLFWQAMFEGARRPSGVGLAVLCLFATSLVAGALGALMAFSEGPWYARYAELGLAPTGLTPTQDQQLAGLLMWIPGGLVHAGAGLWLIHRTLLRNPPAPQAL